MGAIWRGVVVWCGIIIVEVFHGIARTVLLAPLVGDFRARQIAVFTGSILILIVAAGVHPAGSGRPAWVRPWRLGSSGWY